jgi:hypothetical protein
MSTMGCSEFIEQLDAWMEGEREQQARAHALECSRCRGFADDLDAIQSSAAALMVADPEPPARIWRALRQQLSEEGLIVDGSRNGAGAASRALPLASRPHSWLDGFFAAIPRPAVAAAYLILLCALALGLAGTFGIRTAQTPSFPVSMQLDNDERSAVSSAHGQKSAVSSSLSNNLAIVDNYITLCEKSVQEEPENEVARDYLYQAYQQKADLLAQMTQRGDSIQ